MTEILQPTTQAIDYVPVEAYALEDRLQSPWHRSAYKLEKEYINGLSYPVTVVSRDNFKLTLPPEHFFGVVDFVIHLRLMIRNDIPLDPSALRIQGDAGSICLADMIEKGEVYQQRTHRLFAIEYRLKRDELEKQGGCVYLRNLDMVVSIRDRLYTPDHPLSAQGVHTQRLIETPDANQTDAFGYGLKIVDKHHRYGPRWVNINNAIYRIPVSMDQFMEDGVYLTTSGQSEGSVLYSKPITKRLRFDQADAALRLYQSAELAQTHGDLLTEKENEVKQLTMAHKEREQRAKETMLEKQREADERKHRLEREKHEFEQIRFREEIERKETEGRINRLKDELAELDLKRNEALLQQKAQYDSVTFQRKETSEWVKFLPIVATGIFSIMAAFFKLR